MPTFSTIRPHNYIGRTFWWAHRGLPVKVQIQRLRHSPRGIMTHCKVLKHGFLLPNGKPPGVVIIPLNKLRPA